jgi:hypothetical protein
MFLLENLRSILPAINLYILCTYFYKPVTATTDIHSPDHFINIFRDCNLNFYGERSRDFDYLSELISSRTQSTQTVVLNPFKNFRKWNNSRILHYERRRIFELTTCNVHFIHLSEKSPQVYLLNVLLNLTSQRVEPDFILLSSQTQIQSISNFAAHYDKRYSIFLSLPSKVAFLRQISSSHFDPYLLACFYCDVEDNQNNQFISLSSSQTFPKRSLQNLHKIIHDRLKNMNSSPVDFQDPSLSGRKTVTDCSLLKDGLDTNEYRCTVDVVMKKFNVSRISTKNPSARSQSKLVGATYVGYEASFHLFNAIFANELVVIRRTQWIHYACHSKEFQMVLYVNKDSNVNFLRLLQPFDLMIWAFIILSSLLIAIILWNFGQSPIFWTISVLLDQPDDAETTRLWRKNTMFAFPLLAWFFVGFHLGNEYSGSLFSCLAALLPPKDVPRSISELVLNSTVVYATTTSHIVYYIGTARHSTLKDVVLHDLISREGYSVEFYQKFRSRLNFLNGTSQELVYNISKNYRIRVDGKDDALQVPDTFALIDTLQSELLFSTFMRKHTNYYFIKNKNPPANPYLSHIPWMGVKNFFLRDMFIPTLATLYESGIYEIWRKQDVLFRVIQNLKFENRDRSRMGKQIVTGFENFERYFSLVTLSPKEQDEVKAVNLMDIQVAMMFFSGLLLICAVTAALEIWFKRIHVRNLKSKNAVQNADYF